MRLIRNIILGLVMIAVLSAVDFYYINRSAEFSEIYPFNRIYRENRLVYETGHSSDSLPYGSIITGIEKEPVNDFNLISILKKHRNTKELNVEYVHNGRAENRIILKEDINTDYLTFLLLLLLFANVYCVWGFFIILINPHQYQGRLYFFCAIVFSVFYFQLCELFIFREHLVLFIAAGLFLGYMIVLLGHNISNQRMSRSTVYIFITALFVYLIFALWEYYKDPRLLYPITYLLYFIVFCFCFSFVKMFIKRREKKNFVLIRRNIQILLSVIIGYALPCAAAAAEEYTGNYLPIPFILSLNLLAPLLIGNGVLQNSYYGLMQLKYSNRSIIIINVLAAVVSGYLLSTFYYIRGSLFYKSSHFAAVLIFIFLLFQVLYLINKKSLRQGFPRKEKFAYSLQNIAELSASPEDLIFKLKNIFSEIMNLVKITDLKLILFSNLLYDEYYFSADKYIEILPLNSDLGRFLCLNKRPFFKYQLIESSRLREEVVRFLDMREASFVLPVFRGRELKLALLVGGIAGSKNSEIFSNHEVQYFIGVAEQLNRIIDNDRLYRDYITQKRYEREFDNASYVQLRLFPKVVPERQRGLDINFYFRPYQRIIGDYFDFINIDESRTAVIIGDVSGHGLSASMILSAINSITYSMLSERMSLELTFNEINFFLNNSFKGNELLTLFIGIFDKTTGEMEYINAGHLAPVLIKKERREMVRIENRGKILGADRDVSYSASRQAFHKNDEIILYTDGIVEIVNQTTGEKLDEKRLLKVINENIDENIDGKINAMEKEINYFNDAIKDDITIIGVGIL